MITQRAKLRRLAFIPCPSPPGGLPRLHTVSYRPIHDHFGRNRRSDTIYVPRGALPREAGRFLVAILPRLAPARGACLPALAAGAGVRRGGAGSSTSFDAVRVTSAPPDVRRKRRVLFQCARARAH